MKRLLLLIGLGAAAAAIFCSTSADIPRSKR